MTSMYLSGVVSFAAIRTCIARSSVLWVPASLYKADDRHGSSVTFSGSVHQQHRPYSH